MARAAFRAGQQKRRHDYRGEGEQLPHALNVPALRTNKRRERQQILLLVALGRSVQADPCFREFVLPVSENRWGKYLQPPTLAPPFTARFRFSAF